MLTDLSWDGVGMGWRRGRHVYSKHVVVREELARISSFLPPCGSWGTKLKASDGQQAVLPHQPSCCLWRDGKDSQRFPSVGFVGWFVLTSECRGLIVLRLVVLEVCNRFVIMYIIK